MIDWNEIATPPKATSMQDAARVLYARRRERANGIFEKVFDREDKYYFSSSEAHALDRRIK